MNFDCNYFNCESNQFINPHFNHYTTPTSAFSSYYTTPTSAFSNYYTTPAQVTYAQSTTPAQYQLQVSSIQSYQQESQFHNNPYSQSSVHSIGAHSIGIPIGQERDTSSLACKYGENPSNLISLQTGWRENLREKDTNLFHKQFNYGNAPHRSLHLIPNETPPDQRLNHQTPKCSVGTDSCINSVDTHSCINNVGTHSCINSVGSKMLRVQKVGGAKGIKGTDKKLKRVKSGEVSKLNQEKFKLDPNKNTDAQLCDDAKRKATSDGANGKLDANEKSDANGKSDANEKSDAKDGDAKSSVSERKRCRHNFTEKQSSVLEKVFDVTTHYPDWVTVLDLAKRLRLPSERIQVWFQNRRAKFRRNCGPK